MTENEAIEELKMFPVWNMDDQWLNADDMEELIHFCAKAIEKVQQYREIGTVKELKELKECAFSGMELASICIAMQHLKKYEAVGTIEECRAAVEKQEANMQGITSFLCERKSEYQKRYNRAYEQEKQARKFLEDEPDREDVKSDLNHFIKLQDRYNALVDFINELQEYYS